MESPRAITRILLPVKRGSLLHRPRLVDFLHEHIDRKLLLVSAPAGYGKTSVLIDFAYDTTLPVCWYSLDASDADPKIFLEYLIASLRRRFSDFGSRTMSLLSDSPSLHNADVIAGTLVTEIYESIPSYFILILDDYHLVEEAVTVNHILDALLRLLPENAHLVLAGRTLPSRIDLTRLTARQEIAGLGMNDLRFTEDEIRALVRENYHVDLLQKDAAELAANSEGWIAGILLTTHRLWQGLFQSLVKEKGQHSHVFGYLASEVFTQQPPPLQRFLLDSSVFAELSPAVCDELLSINNAAEMLHAIEQRNLFITRLEGNESWYRYHHLFQGFLESRLSETDYARWHGLHRRAAAFFESRGAWDQAVGHDLKVEAFQEAAHVIERAAKSTFDGGHWTTLARWIDALPTELTGAHPDLIVWRAHIFAETGSLGEASKLYSHALKLFEQMGDTIGVGKTLIKQAISWRFQGHYEQAIENCQRALSLLDDNARDQIAIAHRLMGIACGLLGNLTKGIQELELALKSYESLNDLTNIALVHHDLGVAHRTAGDNNAQEHFRQALDFWQRTNNPVGLANTLNSIGVGYHRQGNYSKAIETLEQARAEAHRAGQLRVEALALASLGDVFKDKGECVRAQEIYRTAFEIARRINEGFVITYILNALGETLLLTGVLDTAEQLLHQAYDQAESHRSKYELGLTNTELGILNYEKGNASAAEEYLARAIELLEQSGAKRDSARAHFHLAQAMFLRHKYRQVSQHLQVTANLGKHLGEDQFIVAERRRALPLIKYAVSRKIGNAYFRRVLTKLESLPIVAEDVSQEEQTEGKMPHIRAYAFGTAKVLAEGKEITKSDWDSTTAKELFFLLLANPQGLRKEEILDALWGEISAVKANGIFHSTAYRTRRAVLSNCLIYSNGLYRLDRRVDLWDDVSEFNRLIREAQTLDLEAKRAEFHREAIALYQGDYFEDSYNDWCIPIRSNLQVKYLDAACSLANYYEKRSEIAEAFTLCQKILNKDPYREEIYRTLMRLQAKSGDRSGAIKTYQRCVDILRAELNLRPGPETRTLYEQILKGD